MTYMYDFMFLRDGSVFNAIELAITSMISRF